MKIAITGTIGSGKSTVSAYLSDKGYRIYDTDKMVHDHYKQKGTLYRKVVSLFGTQILSGDQAIDHRKLAGIVFNDFKMLSELERLVFPAIAHDIDALIVSDNELVFFEVPLLFEAGMEDDFDAVIMVDADIDVRLDRLNQRGLTKKDARNRMKRHLDPKIKRAKSDYLLLNNGTIEVLNDAIATLIATIEKGVSGNETKP